MATANDNGFLTIQAHEALGKHIRVKLSSGKAAIAGAGQESIGTTVQSVASGGQATVKLDTAPGTHIVTAAGTITSGTNLYQAASGQVSGTISGRRIGIALTAGSAAARMEMLPVGVNS